MTYDFCLDTRSVDAVENISKEIMMFKEIRTTSQLELIPILLTDVQVSKRENDHQSS